MINSGIYAIKSLDGRKVYVGSSDDIDRRYKEHIRRLKANNHKNNKLQNYYNKYGAGNLSFIILEKCGVNLLLEKEQFYIDYFSHFVDLFNLSPISRSCYSSRDSKETRDKISKSVSRFWSDDSNRSRMSEAMSNSWTEDKRKIMAENRSKIYEGFVAPDGTVYTQIKNLTEFCRKHNLTQSQMSRLDSGIMKSHKGWTKLG